MSFGIASYDFTNGAFVYLGKNEINGMKSRILLCALAYHLSDMVSLFSIRDQNIKVNSAKTTK